MAPVLATSTGCYYDNLGQFVTYTVASGDSILKTPSTDGLILLAQTDSVAFSNGKSVLGYMTTNGKEYYRTPEELMSAMERIDFLIFIAGPPGPQIANHHHHHPTIMRLNGLIL